MPGWMIVFAISLVLNGVAIVCVWATLSEVLMVRKQIRAERLIRQALAKKLTTSMKDLARLESAMDILEQAIIERSDDDMIQFIPDFGPKKDDKDNGGEVH